MSREGRRQKLENELRALEEQFNADLISALRECAAGKWGMFGRNDLIIQQQASHVQELLRSDAADKLLKDGEQIMRLRQRLGYADPFPEFERYLEYRKMNSPSTPGEPKLAVQFLRELGSERRR